MCKRLISILLFLMALSIAVHGIAIKPDFRFGAGAVFKKDAGKMFLTVSFDFIELDKKFLIGIDGGIREAPSAHLYAFICGISFKSILIDSKSSKKRLVLPVGITAKKEIYAGLIYKW